MCEIHHIKKTFYDKNIKLILKHVTHIFSIFSIIMLCEFDVTVKHKESGIDDIVLCSARE